MELPTPCASCGRPTVARVEDAVSLAAFVVLGALCPGCAARQPRQMVFDPNRP